MNHFCVVKNQGLKSVITSNLVSNSLYRTPTSVKGALKSDTVNFTGRLPFINVKKIPCACCGKFMVTPDEFTNILTEKVLSGNSTIALKAISNFQDSLNKTEKSVFEILKNLSKEYPKLTLQELLSKIMRKSLSNLQKRQLSAIGEIELYKKELPPESFRKIGQITNEAKSIIYDERDHIRFKRKIFISKLENLKEVIPEQDVFDKILKKASELETSSNDIDAFIVKYADRSSTEIGQRLVSPSLATIEHVHPKSLNGANDSVNYILECKDCNGRRGNMPLQQWLEMNPKMLQNIQKYINRVIEIIKSKKMYEFSWYPEAIKQTLKNESQGLIKLEIPTTGIKAD